LQIFRIIFTTTTVLEHQIQYDILSYFTIASDSALALLLSFKILL